MTHIKETNRMMKQSENKTMKDIHKSSNNLGQLVILSLASQQYCLLTAILRR